MNLVEGVAVGVAFKLHLDANVGNPGTLVVGKVADTPGGRNINVAFDINFDCGKGNATVGGNGLNAYGDAGGKCAWATSVGLGAESSPSSAGGSDTSTGSSPRTLV